MTNLCRVSSMPCMSRSSFLVSPCAGSVHSNKPWISSAVKYLTVCPGETARSPVDRYWLGHPFEWRCSRVNHGGFQALRPYNKNRPVEGTWCQGHQKQAMAPLLLLGLQGSLSQTHFEDLQAKHLVLGPWLSPMGWKTSKQTHKTTKQTEPNNRNKHVWSGTSHVSRR